MSEATPPDPNSGGPSRLVLFVCQANVCRSPTMDFLTRRALEEHGLAPGWQFGSAGVSASDGQSMCRVVAKAVEKEPSGEAFARGHRSRRLSADQVEEAGLILVASQHERSALTRLSAGARRRTFTMIEAALLSSSAADRGGSLGAAPGALALDDVVELMHGHRGTLAHGHPGQVRGRLLPRSRRPTDLDVRDFHNGEVRSHTPVLDNLRWASSTFVTALGRLQSTAR